MPAARPVLTRHEAAALVARSGFDGSAPGPSHPPRLGIELEWQVVDLDDPTRPASFDVVRRSTDSLGPTPGGSALTFEPGGQLELSSPPADLGTVCPLLARDAAYVGSALARARVGLIAVGLEPGPRRSRAIHTPRYDAMERHFDATNDAGRAMMRSTASVQVNLDVGATSDERERRWRTAHDIGPMLGASFANSPLGTDGPTGLRSTRLAIWSAIDAARTGSARGNGDGCVRAWVDYAFAAPVMLIRRDDDHHEPVLTRLTFAEWMEQGHDLGWPTPEDLTYHLTTLFPPVRPHGHLELRMVDAVPSPWWRVAATVAAVLVYDERLADVVARTAATTGDRWEQAGRDALGDAPLHAAARACFAAARSVLESWGVDEATIAATRDYQERYIEPGRTPADDRLAEWRRSGHGVPVPENCPSAPESAP